MSKSAMPRYQTFLSKKPQGFMSLVTPSLISVALVPFFFASGSTMGRMKANFSGMGVPCLMNSSAASWTAVP